MTPATAKMHKSFIRLSKGFISVWEEWVKAQEPLQEVKINPDPAKFFGELNNKQQ